MSDLITPYEVSEILGVKIETLASWRCTEAVIIPYVKIGSCVRYKTSDIQEYIEKHTIH